MVRSRAVVLLAVCLSVQACVTTPRLGVEPVRTAFPAARQMIGTVTLQARLAIASYRRLLAVVNPWAATDIDHVRLDLFQGAVLRGTLTVSQAQLNTVVRFSNLLPNTTYSIQARAWQDGAETVPIDSFDTDSASCTTVFATTTDDWLSLPSGIALRLRDKAFSGLGAGAIAVTAGGWTTPTTESIALRTNSRVVSTLAGASSGYVDATGASARFAEPTGVAVDASGNVYVADRINNRIRKITAGGSVSTLAGSTAGSADGTGTAAQFNGPAGLALDSAGNLYVADQNNHRIRKVTPTGVVTTFAGSAQGSADGTGTAAQFNSPYGLAVDGTGKVYVADTFNHQIRTITAAGVVNTLTGSGFWEPTGVALDAAGNLYVADQGNHRIAKVTQAGVVTTLAGGYLGYVDGTVANAEFALPTGIIVDPAGNLFVADQGNHSIRKLTTAGVVSTFVGDGSAGFLDATGNSARFSSPTGLAMDPSGKIYVADAFNHRVRRVE